MNEKSKGMAKSLSALTLVVVASGGAAMAHDTATLVSPSEEAVAQATAIQLEDFVLDNVASHPVAAADHHDHVTSPTGAFVSGSEFDV